MVISLQTITSFRKENPIWIYGVMNKLMSNTYVYGIFYDMPVE